MAPILSVELTSFTVQANREIHPDKATLEIYSKEQKAQRKGSDAELPGKTQIIFTECLRYCLEHTYMKNYSSLAENSNLTGPPGFLLAVFGKYAPSLHERQTLERQKATDPCMCSVVFLTVLATVFSLGFYPMHTRNRAGTFTSSSVMPEKTKPSPWRDSTQQGTTLYTVLTSEAQTPPGPPSTLKDSVLVGVLSIFFFYARNLEIYKNYKMRKDWVPIFS